MKKISDMVKHSRIKFSQRPRMRTSTKLVMVFGLFSFVSIVCLVFFFLNISNNKPSMGLDVLPEPVVINGKQEVFEEKLLTDFEVKELDTRSFTMANDTVVLYKKIKP